MGWIAVSCAGALGAATALVMDARMRGEPTAWGAVFFGVVAVLVFIIFGGNA